MEQPPEQVRPPLVAHPEATAAEQPGEGPLNHPAVPPQLLARLDPAASDLRGDAADTQRAALLGGVVRLVRVQLGRTLPRTARSSARAGTRSSPGPPTTNSEATVPSGASAIPDGVPGSATSAAASRGAWRWRLPVRIT